VHRQMHDRAGCDRQRWRFAERWLHGIDLLHQSYETS
jgi:hypothetical protein